MGLYYNFIRHAKRDLDKLVTPKLQKFNKPSFGKGFSGTLHGERSDSGGYKFLRIKLFGHPNVKSVKGCQLVFESTSGTIKCESDTKGIESYYSQSLQKGITTFEIYLDDELHRLLKDTVNSLTITLPKQFFGKNTYDFQIQSDAFSKLMH